jgi:hypothetical protein
MTSTEQSLPCQATLIEQKNTDGTVTLMVTCPFVASKLCPNEQILPDSTWDMDPQDMRLAEERDRMSIDTNYLQRTCPGPRRQAR